MPLVYLSHWCLVQVGHLYSLFCCFSLVILAAASLIVVMHIFLFYLFLNSYRYCCLNLNKPQLICIRSSLYITSFIQFLVKVDNKESVWVDLLWYLLSCNLPLLITLLGVSCDRHKIRNNSHIIYSLWFMVVPCRCSPSGRMHVYSCPKACQVWSSVAFLRHLEGRCGNSWLAVVMILTWWRPTECSLQRWVLVFLVCVIADPWSLSIFVRGNSWYIFSMYTKHVFHECVCKYLHKHYHNFLIVCTLSWAVVLITLPIWSTIYLFILPFLLPVVYDFIYISLMEIAIL